MISQTEPISRAQRYRGCLLGLAAGDALGTTLEFSVPGHFKPISDMIGGGPFDLRAGEWTDDTSMALCLAESLINCRGFDPCDQMQRYVRWYEEGHLSSNGTCFDIGNTTQRSLLKFKSTNEPYSGSTSSQESGNGCIMRLAPVPMFFAKDPEQAIHYSGESSRTTHGAQMCINGSRYFAALLVGALGGMTKDELLGEVFTPVADLWSRHPLGDEVERIARGSFREKQPPKICSTGFVIDCLEAALWAFHSTSNFRDGALIVVNLGGDADTAGAVYGQLAGAYYGEDSIPLPWRKKLAHRQTIESFADQLLHLSQQ